MKACAEYFDIYFNTEKTKNFNAIYIELANSSNHSGNCIKIIVHLVLFYGKPYFMYINVEECKGVMHNSG